MTELLSAEEFASRYPDQYTVQLNIPSDSNSNWGLKGQSFSVSVDANLSVRALKELVSQKVQATGQGTEAIPINRFQLKLVSSAVFLKDSSNLATHNVIPNAQIELTVKSRR